MILLFRNRHNARKWMDEEASSVGSVTLVSCWTSMKILITINYVVLPVTNEYTSVDHDHEHPHYYNQEHDH